MTKAFLTFFAMSLLVLGFASVPVWAEEDVSVEAEATMEHDAEVADDCAHEATADGEEHDADADAEATDDCADAADDGEHAESAEDGETHE